MANLKHPPGNEGIFYPLDNSAVFIASVSGKSSPYIFRVSCELDDIVYLPALEEALSSVMPRFPSLSTELRSGLFWYYLEPLAKPVSLQADTRYPVEYHSLNRRDRHLFRVRAYGSRISCEFHHILTDGSGAIEFLRSLVATYLTCRGVSCDDWEGVKKPSSPIVPGELSDSYAELSPGKIPLPDRLPAAFHLPGRRYGAHAYRVISGTVALSAALRISREKGVSLTELLSAIYLAALQDVHEDENPSRWHPLCVQVPVNMRRFHPSVSLRNFFLFITVSIDRRLGHYGFQEILDRVHCLFRLNLTEKELNRQIRRNVGSERNIVSRLFPLVVKNPVLKVVSRFAAERPFSGNLSNLQSVSMPAPFAAHIRRFDILPSRRTGIGATIGVVSWQDVLSVTVGSMAVSRAFERRFFIRCVELGMPVRVESNM
jgi:hypothetical protein